MIAEVLTEFVHEVTAEPWRLALEVLQFVILAAIVWMGAVGIGKRRGIIVARLATRRERLGERLARADGAAGDLETARREAEERVRDSRAEAQTLMEDAEREAARIHDETRTDVADQVATTVRRVEESLAAEAEEARSSLREQLVEVVALASRSVLSQMVSATEQRELIEQAVGAATAAPKESDAGPGGRTPSRRPHHEP
ncbi:MAG: hypothetical protein HY876_06335 [Coriobacteriales bacterium]|nr:hypothetical protein [Coriobacteriales bacterium]